MQRQFTALATLQGQLVVSVQAEGASPLNHPHRLTALALACVQGGAAGLRLADAMVVARCRKALGPTFPIIGLRKRLAEDANPLTTPYITPTVADALTLIEAGATLIALDATDRPLYGVPPLKERVATLRQKAPYVAIMGDVDSVHTALLAVDAGCDVVSTTLCGYTQDTAHLAQPNSPDWPTLQQLVNRLKGRCPVVAEGRFWTPEQVAQAKAMGAFSVVVGSAITRPHLITARFASALH